jgi:hypothetical protein
MRFVLATFELGPNNTPENTLITALPIIHSTLRDFQPYMQDWDHVQLGDNREQDVKLIVSWHGLG